jgi:hypothetical protein
MRSTDGYGVRWSIFVGVLLTAHTDDPEDDTTEQDPHKCPRQALPLEDQSVWASMRQRCLSGQNACVVALGAKPLDEADPSGTGS